MHPFDFHFTQAPSQVHFGPGKVAVLPSLLASYTHAFIIGGKRIQPILDQLSENYSRERFYHFPHVVQHVPHILVDQAFKMSQANTSEVLVAIGGGSAIGLAKALALRKPLPIIAVPTTYAGSEMTNIWGISTENGKTTGRNPVVQPQQVIYDAHLTATMPKSLAVTSSMNAMAHLMEAVYSPEGNPLTHQHALYGIRQLREGLHQLALSDTLSMETNQQLQLGAFLAGKCLGEVPMALHHKAAHVLGGSFQLDHAQVHTVLQAYVLEYQWPQLSEATRQDFQTAFSHPYPPRALQDLAQSNGAPHTLRTIGLG